MLAALRGENLNVTCFFFFFNCDVFLRTPAKCLVTALLPRTDPLHVPVLRNTLQVRDGNGSIIAT